MLLLLSLGAVRCVPYKSESFGQSQMPIMSFFSQQPLLLGATHCMRTRDKPARVHGSRGGIQRSTKGEGRSSGTSRHSNTVKKCRAYLPSILPRGWIAKPLGQRLFEAATQGADKNVIPTAAINIFKVTPLYLRTTTPPVKIGKHARACHPKSKIVPTSCLSLSPRTRSRRGKQGERRARGVEADPRRER